MELERWEKVTGSFFYVGYTMKGPGSVTSALVFLAAWFIKPDAVLIGTLLYLFYRFKQGFENIEQSPYNKKNKVVNKLMRNKA